MGLVVYDDFSGGINEQLPYIIQEKTPGEGMYHAYTANNWEMAKNGLIKYPGASTVLSAALSGAPTIMGIFEYKRTDGTKTMIVCAGGKIYSVSGSTATQLATGLTSGKQYQAVQFQDVLLLMNGVDKVQAYDGTNVTAVTMTDPNAIWNDARPRGASLFRQRIFYWGDATYKDRIYTPKPNTYKDFDESTGEVDALDIGQGTGRGISGVKAFTNDLLIIYKFDSGVYRLSGSGPFGSSSDAFQIHEVSQRSNLIAPGALVDLTVDHFYLSDSGVEQFSQTNTYGDVEYNAPTWNLQQTTIPGLNYTATAMDFACGIFDKPANRIYFSVPDGSSTTNNKLIVYNVITKTCEVGSGLGIACFGNVNRQIYYGGYDGQIYKAGSGTSWGASTVISSLWETFYVAHEGLTYKRYKSLTIEAEGSGKTDLVIHWGILRRGEEFLDADTESLSSATGWDQGLWDTMLWSTGQFGSFFKKNLGRGYAFKLRIENNTSDQRPKIRTIQLEYEVLGLARG